MVNVQVNKGKYFDSLLKDPTSSIEYISKSFGEIILN